MKRLDIRQNSSTLCNKFKPIAKYGGGADVISTYFNMIILICESKYALCEFHQLINNRQSTYCLGKNVPEEL